MGSLAPTEPRRFVEQFVCAIHVLLVCAPLASRHGSSANHIVAQQQAQHGFKLALSFSGITPEAHKVCRLLPASLALEAAVWGSLALRPHPHAVSDQKLSDGMSVIRVARSEVCRSLRFPQHRR
jgi:hypothetical protein